MWLDAKSQRRKVIDTAIEVAAYLQVVQERQSSDRSKAEGHLDVPALSFFLLSTTYQLA